MIATRATVTARPSGRDRHGNPLRERTYVTDRGLEDWGDGRTRIFVEGAVRSPRGDFYWQPQLVRTDSIQSSDDLGALRCPGRGRRPSSECADPSHVRCVAVATKAVPA